MYSFILRLLARAAQKVGAIVIVAALALLVAAGWLYLRDRQQAGTVRTVNLQALGAERDQLLAAKAALEKRIAGFRAEAVEQRRRLQQAEKALATLRSLQSWWQRVFGNAEQQKANDVQIARLEALKSEAGTRIATLQQEVTRSVWEKDGAEIRLNRIAAELRAGTAPESRWGRHLRRAWDESKTWIILGIALWLVGPTLWALAMYYGFAAFIARGAPIRFSGEPAPALGSGASGVSAEVALAPGEVLRVREKFLQASDEALRRRTRFLLDWRIPFTSLACGLTELVEMANEGAAPARATLSDAADPHVELAVVRIPAGARLILRPSFLAGVIQPAGGRLEIRRRWQLFRWQSWITGQLRFFEFAGPCQLVVSGSRGVRFERLERASGAPEPARRTNQDATIGFTPGLLYRPVRAETFWSYYRGMNPLFDDIFCGEGLFLCQEVSAPGEGAKARRFWAGVWNGVLKVFGM